MLENASRMQQIVANVAIVRPSSLSNPLSRIDRIYVKLRCRYQAAERSSSPWRLSAIIMIAMKANPKMIMHQVIKPLKVLGV